MGKVSIGLRGWRFDEEDVFTDDEEFKPLKEIPEDPRQRLLRLSRLIEQPCDACYLIHGEADKQQCNRSAVVYGEPMDEVVLCADHESDFIYWYQHEGGSDLRGEPEFADVFHQWFADGNRAPEGFGSVDHVETDPEDLPDLPTPEEIQQRLEADYEPRKIDLREYVDEPEEPTDEVDRIDDEELDDLDLDTSYPTGDE
ncbi:MAG: hypothetical protein ACOCP2_01310 [Halohasta sp.]